jgi:RND superfamily putative drug exporter
MSSWAVRRPVWALIVWFVLLIAIGGAAKSLGGEFNNSFALPGVESTVAQDMLQKLSTKSTDDTSITVVWRPTEGKATDDATRKAIDPTLEKLAALPNVTCVVGPYDKDFGSSCPKVSHKTLEEVVTDKVNEKVAKAAKMTPEQLAQVGPLLAKLMPVESASPAQLGKVAAALPSLAKLASAPKPILDGLASIRPDDWKQIPGFTKEDADKITAAFGGLDKVAQLPAGTLDAVAKTNPQALADAAERIPGQVGELEKDWAQFQSDLKTLQDAAKASERATSQISEDKRIAYATVTVAEPTLSASEADAFYDILKAASSDTLEVGAQGASLEGAGAPAPDSEAIGLLAAIIILLIAFGSLVAAGLPIIVAITGLVGGQLLVLVVARFLDVASFAPTLAAMIGMGVGIDYALFILNRFRQGVQDGKDPKDAALIAVRTAGRAVLFAGCTVIMALLGMFVLNIRFFDGLAVAAGVAVLMVMLSALLFLPALLSLLGAHSLGIRMPWARHLKPFDPDASRWSGYGRLLQRAPVVPMVLALVVIGVLAWPATSMRLGFPDDGTQATGTPLRTGFDLMAEGFGDGVNGPFFVAVQVPKKDDVDGLKETIRALEETDGVARTLPDSKMMPLVSQDKTLFGDDGKVTSIVVYPKTSPQDPTTGELLDRIRSETAPKLAAAHDVKIFVGGSQAVSTDFTEVLGKALPVFLLLVVGLGFLALMLLFRSILIPLTAAITSLLSFAAALGITVSVFQIGRLADVLGITGTGPILPFLPIMVFAILFGLSMDYQVFLVSRMRESWEHGADNRTSVRQGLAGSGRVVVVAASIMTCVFSAFIPSPVDTIKLFGVALASAVLVDAFIVRLILVPSAMTLFGKANWWIPRWLGKVLPKISVD